MNTDTYTFSYARKTGQMRFRKDGRQVHVDQLAGQWWVHDADRDGRITAECALTVQEQGGRKIASVYHPNVHEEQLADDAVACSFDDNADHHLCRAYSDRPFPNGTVAKYRICYDRQAATSSETTPCWRLRNENTGEVWLIAGYRGPMNVVYFDGGSHVHTNDAAWVDGEGMVRFGAP